MKVAFDGQIFFLQSFGGISRYFTSLAKTLSVDGNDVGVFVPLHRNHYLHELPARVVHGFQLRKFPGKGLRVLQFLNNLMVKLRLVLWRPDIVHETYYAATTAAPRHCPVVVTVYDMIHEIFSGEFSENDPTTRLKRLATERADHVICISESTRRDLIRIFGLPEEKISVVHLGFNRMPSGAVADSPVSVRPYLLYVGNRAGYKNFTGMLHAVAASERLRRDFDIVAFGGGKFSSVERDLIANLGLGADQVRHLGGGDEYLGVLYRQASAFVYPSLYEGFGLPPLEAMAQNCPVVSSNTSSMPEVIGDAAEFFDPARPDDMADAIERVVYDAQRVADLRERGQRRLEVFSWQKCARDTMSIYRKVRGE
jgi:glycosyltransferase involved in cell wall biosynthesis